MLRTIYAIIIFTVFAPSLHAWWSVEAFPTHKGISESGIIYLEQRYPGEYPDIKKFKKTIIDATYTADNDKVAHGYDVAVPTTTEAGRYAGGDFAKIWNRLVPLAYKDSKFAGNNNAYFRIGSMAHLVQDQAVPAHAANIYHGFYKNSWDSYEADPDDLEAITGYFNLAPIITTAAYSGNDPSTYYYKDGKKDFSPIVGTQEEIKTLRYPADGPVLGWRDRRYWYENGQPQYKYTGQAFFPNADFALHLGWGVYGGPDSEDMYGRFPLPLLLPAYYTTDDPYEGIAKAQLKEAASYTAGMLMAVSESLPAVVQSPLINNTTSSPATVSPGQNNTISFTLLDNRTPVVTYRLLVDENDAASSNDIISTQTVTLTPDNPDETSLPFFLAVTKDWNGLLASGSPITALPDGTPHTLYIIGKDQDGNDFDYVVGSFTVAGGPLVTVETPMSTPYVAVSGINAGGLSPALINPASLGGAVNITVAPNGFLVAQLIVKDPSGTETPYAHAGPDTIQHQALAGTVDGPYQLTALDTAGNRTSVAFTLGTSVLAAKPAESTATYSGGGDSFSAQFKYHLKDYFPLAKAELYLGYEPAGGGGTPLRTDLLSGTAAELTYAFPDLFTTAGFTRDFNTNPALASYTVKMQNAEGQTRAEVLTLAGYSRQHYSAGTLDLISEAGTLPQAMGRTKKEWLGVGVNDSAHQNVSGPLLNYQAVGSYTVGVLTGDKPDLSDGVAAELGAGSYYYSVWNFRVNGAPSQNCTTVKGVDEGCFSGTIDLQLCEGAILCHNSTVMLPTNLKRYSRVVTELSPAPLTGIFKYLCDDLPVGQDQCESGHQPGLVEGITQLEAWGVRAGYGGGYLSGGLTAQVPAGANVSVKLASWLDLTFENVSTPGFVEATLVEVPAMPGILPLRTLALSSPNVAYSGNISVSMKYDGGGITDGQAGFMEALRINNSATRDFIKYAAAVDRINQTAVFTVPALGSFMLEVPSYPAPYAYASAGLNLLSGEPDVAVTQIAPGSPLDVTATKILNDRGFVSLENAYVIGPSGKMFQQPAAITMRYDKSLVPAKNIVENSLGIYQLSEDGQYLARLGNAVLNKEKGEISAEVTELHSIFVIAGSTYPAQPAPLLPDQTRPVSNLAFGIPAYEAGGMVMISSASPVFVDAYDPETAGHVTSGPGTKYYLADIPPDTCVFAPPFVGTPGTCQNPIYSSPFTLSPGVHTVWYKSEDNALNAETIKSQMLYVDGDVPVVTVSAAGQPVAPGGTAYITEVDSITLTGTDPSLSGPASGLGGMVFDVSTTPCLGFANYPQTPGICREILYTAPFSLPVGTHTVYYSAMDNVGNVAEMRSISLNVSKTIEMSFKASEVKVDSVQWGWEPAAESTGYQVFASSGGAVSSLLSAETTYYRQAGLAPDSEYGGYLKIFLGGMEFDSTVSSAVTLANAPGFPEVFAIGQYPVLAIGQGDFVSVTAGAGATGLSSPISGVADAEGNLWVSDHGNRRVLRFPAEQSTGMSADIVIGQADFSSQGSVRSQSGFGGYPAGLAVDSSGALWVADDCRILRFTPPFANGMNADLIIGGADFNSCFSGVSASALRPVGLRFDAQGNLWVADNNNRVLRFSPPFINGQAANLVLGQSFFTTSSYAYPPTRNSLYWPTDMAFDSAGRVFISERYNDRVTVFTPPFVNGMNASLVIGQPDFVTNDLLTGIRAPSKNSLDRPNSVSIDSFDNLYVSDMGNRRILKFRPPFASGMDASLVLGQPDFLTEFNINISNTFNQAFDSDVAGFIASDSDGRLWVTDTGNNRVLAFDPVRTGIFSEISSEGFSVSWLANGNPAWTDYTAQLASNKDFSGVVLLSSVQDIQSASFNGLTPNATYYARARAVNSSGIASAWTALSFVRTKPAVPSGFAGASDSADSVLWNWSPEAGLKYRLYSSTGGVLSAVLMEGTSCYRQTGLEPNRQYSAYVRAINPAGYADSLPAAKFTLAAAPAAPEPFIIGQQPAVMLGGAQGLSADKFIQPYNVAVGPDGALWVHDTPACRLLRFPAPQAGGMSANVVLGQTDYISSVCGTGPNRISNSLGGVAFDRSGNLWLADSGNHRVLRFSPPFINGKSADKVLGQADLNSNTAGTTAGKLSSPWDVAFDAEGRLWVTDLGNRRALRFDLPLESGKEASVVLGQPDFTSKYTVTDSTAYFGGFGIAVDRNGAVWVAAQQYTENRLLKFSPPFINGMGASLVMQSASSYGPLPTTMLEPSKIAFDETGAMYVGDTYRVLKFNPPFSNGMSATTVLGKNNFYTTTEGAISFPRSISIGNGPGGPTLWASDPSNYKVFSFAPSESPFYNVFATSFSVKWQASGNPAGTGYKVELSSTNEFAAPTNESAWISAASFSFEGLAGDTSYYARIKSRNTEGYEGGYSYLGHALTLRDINYITVQSTVVVGTTAELVFTSTKDASVTLLSTTTGSGAFALAAAGGMELLSNIYEIGPDGIYDPPATVVFSYDDTLLPEGLLESDIAVYEYFADSGWRKLDGQVLDEAGNKITVPVTQIASLFGVFGVMQDRTPPATKLDLGSGAWSDAAGNAFINAGSSVALAASDPVVYGTSTGVAYTEYRIDAATSAPFARYAGPFMLTPGRHALEFRSADIAGNIEVSVSSAVYADALPPATLAVIASTRGLDDWQISAATVSLAASDAMSGVRELSYSVAGGSFTQYSSPLLVTTEGTRLLEYYSVDNVGNREESLALEVKVDLTPPTAGLELEGVYNADGTLFMSAFSGFAELTTTDTVSGAKAAYYKISASTSDLPSVLGPDTTAQFTVYAGTFTLAEGRSVLAFGAADNAGHYTTISIIEVNADGTAPLTTLLFDTTEYVSPEGGSYVNGGSSVGLVAADPAGNAVASGVRETRYALNGATYTYNLPFRLADGPAALEYYSVDNTGNSEPVVRREFSVDNTPPVSAYLVEGYQNLSGGVLYLAPNSTFTLSAQDPAVNGTASGLAHTEYSLTAVSASGDRTLVSSGTYGRVRFPSAGAYELAYLASDNVLNAEPAVALGVIVALPAAMSLTLEPSVINLKSQGQHVSAVLEAAGEYSSADIAPATIRITKINEAALAAPVGIDLEQAGRGKYKHVHLGDADGDGTQDLSVKFDRQALTAVLPVGEQVRLVAEGSFTDGGAFTAEAYIRVIAPGKQVDKGGGRAAHSSGAAVDIPKSALNETLEITILKISADSPVETLGRGAAAGKLKLRSKGAVHEFGPDGTVFAKPVSISLPCGDCGRNEQPVIGYWNQSSREWEILVSSYDAVSRKVLAETSHFSLYQVLTPVVAAAPAEAARASVSASPAVSAVVLAGPDPEFKLGEVYVYPNPAKGGQAPTIHLECGIADSVNIKIYTVSGREAHTYAITSAPVALDDGNGLSYAYEYTWSGHIPSGVYYYFLEAERAGKKLKKTGKFAVVR